MSSDSPAECTVVRSGGVLGSGPPGAWRSAASGPFVDTRFMVFDDGVTLDSGRTLRPITVAYEIYGTLNAARDNAILICHALSGGAHAAGWHVNDSKPGWWDCLIGPGKAFDTNRFAVVSSNVLGGCYGTTGPSSTNPETGRPYAAAFPPITIADMVRVQRMLVERLGIRSLATVAGGSMGGMQALQWAAAFPEQVRSVIAIATTARHSAQQIALNEVCRRAIMTDPAWNGGEYYDASQPIAGMAVARMLCHVQCLSDPGMDGRFGRARLSAARRDNWAAPVFAVEQYLHRQADRFVRRFDANSLLYLTRAIDAFDLAAADVGDAGPEVADVRAAVARRLARFRGDVLLLSFESDWFYPPRHLEELAAAFRVPSAEMPQRRVIYERLEGTLGHDTFLVGHPEQESLIRTFLNFETRR